MIFVLYLYGRSHTSLAGGRKVILVILRALIFTFMIIALAGVQILWPIQKIATSFVVDSSYSMAEGDTVLEQVNKAIQDKAPEDKTAIVSVGKEAVIETPLSDKVNTIDSFQTTVNPSYTNLASGLQLAGSQFSEDVRGRVVLMTDGNENIGDAIRQASYLRGQDYIVDVLPFSPAYKEDVAISAFDVPENIYLGEQATLSMTVDSSLDTTSQVRIMMNGENIVDENVELQEGSNQLAFNHLITTDGFHTFRAEIVSEADQVIENNQLAGFAETQGVPNVLIVEGKNDNAANLESSLDASAIQVETIQPELLPGQLSNYLKYDSIILSNVAAHRVTGQQMELIERAVHDFGVGFIMTGGDQSFGVGGYFKTPIEKVLPVDMELKGEKELPSLGLSIVLDKSGSMAGNKIALAREAAARSVELLREKDTLGVTAFDGQPWEVVELGPINDKEDVLTKIRSITASGGTDIFTPLSQSYSQMEPLDLKRKHVILLTDGQSATTINYREMIEESLNEGITLSTVAIGTEADRMLLEEMAQLGGGRFYEVLDNSSIPTILSRETSLVTQTYIEDDPFYPALVNGYEWGSYFENAVPQMNAYIATTQKGRAQQILTSEKEDPILSRWQYGLGKTVAWTSDLTGEWAGGWPKWENWSPLWNDIVTWTFPQYQKESYQITEEIEGNQVTLNVAAPDNHTAHLDAKLVESTGEEVAFDLQPKAPGEYQGKFEANETGVYFLQITEEEDGEVVSSFKTGVVVPYSEEYTFRPLNQQLIEEIASAGGGNVLENLDGAFSSEGLPPRYDQQDIFYLLLSLALLLFLFDVAVRRFRFNFAFINKVNTRLDDKRSRAKEMTEKRSQQLSQIKQASSKKAASSTKQVPPKITKAPIVKPKQTKPPEKPSAKSESREERMARLLDAKKKRSK